MRVHIHPQAKMYADWLEVFGNEPVLVKPAGAGLYRIQLTTLSIAQHRKLAQVVSRRRHILVDVCATRIEKFGCTIEATDVLVMADEEGVLF